MPNSCIICICCRNGKNTFQVFYCRSWFKLRTKKKWPSMKITVIIFLSPGSILTLFLLLLVIISCIFVLKCRSLGHNIQTIPAVQTVQSDPLRLNSNIHSRRPSGTRRLWGFKPDKGGEGEDKECEERRQAPVKVGVVKSTARQRRGGGRRQDEEEEEEGTRQNKSVLYFTFFKERK